MTYMDKFKGLTPEQREQLADVKDMAAMDALASEHGIELTDQEKQDALEYINTGVLPLDDDDLDAAAGGISARKEIALSLAKEEAHGDGRTVMLVKGLWKTTITMCSCDYRYKWAKSTRKGYDRYHPDKDFVDYIDVKCYRCGKTWSVVGGL